MATMQVKAGRHFISEQPFGSDMYKLPAWCGLCRNEKIAQAKVDQCEAGKRGKKSGPPILKTSDFRSNLEESIVGLRRLQRTGRHTHARLGNPAPGALPGTRYERTANHAEWAPGICE